jgi:hypothetical protein
MGHSALIRSASARNCMRYIIGLNVPPGGRFQSGPQTKTPRPDVRRGVSLGLRRGGGLRPDNHCGTGPRATIAALRNGGGALPRVWRPPKS